jgi:hypothetical protein
LSLPTAFASYKFRRPSLISSNVILNPSSSRPVRLPKTCVDRSELTISEIEQKNVYRRLASSSSFTTNSPVASFCKGGIDDETNSPVASFCKGGIDDEVDLLLHF